MTKTVSDLCLQYIWLVFLPFYARGQYDHTCRRGDERPRVGVCGRGLSNTLYLVCGGNFNTYGKRSSDPDVARVPTNINDDLKSDFKDKILSKRGALNFLLKRSGISYQGLTCECCQNHCSVAELRTYCADSNDDEDDGFLSFFNKKKRTLQGALNEKTKSTLKQHIQSADIEQTDSIKTLGQSDYIKTIGNTDSNDTIGKTDNINSLGRTGQS